MGVEMVNGKEITSIDELKKEYDYVVLAVGASDKGTLKLEAGDTMNALDFLAQFKATDGKLDLGKNVVVTVSYTHLDVYKRQRSMCAFSSQLSPGNLTISRKNLVMSF